MTRRSNGEPVITSKQLKVILTIILILVSLSTVIGFGYNNRNDIQNLKEDMTKTISEVDDCKEEINNNKVNTQTIITKLENIEDLVKENRDDIKQLIKK